MNLFKSWEGDKGPFKIPRGFRGMYSPGSMKKHLIGRCQTCRTRSSLTFFAGIPNLCLYIHHEWHSWFQIRPTAQRCSWRSTYLTQNVGQWNKCNDNAGTNGHDFRDKTTAKTLFDLRGWNLLWHLNADWKGVKASSPNTQSRSAFRCTWEAYSPACSSSMLAMSMCPFSTVSCSGLIPPTWLFSTGAGRWRSRASTHAVLPWLQASCKGVQPAWSSRPRNVKQWTSAC